MSVDVRRPPVPRKLGVALSRGRAPGYWGMWMLIFTEAVLFSILLTSYFFIRFQQREWPPDGIADPELFMVAIMTPILLLSSVPVHWADIAVRRGRIGQMKAGLFLAFAMGATFLVLQGFEYRHFLQEFSPRTNVYGSLFFTITGFHGFHVLAGLLMLAWLQLFGWRGYWTKERHLPVQVIAMYWHFVDVVWIFILLTVYLSPYLWPT